MRRLWFLLAVLVLILPSCEWGSEESSTPETTTVVEVPIPNSIDPTIDPDQQQTSEQRPAGIDEHEDAKDETPPGVSQTDVKKINEARPAGLGKPLPLGGAENISCRLHQVVNFNDRAPGSRVSQIIVHYTVSAPGTLDAIWNLFNTPSFAASSHILLEPSGRCEQLVPYSKKAWTQGAFNSVSDSVEIVCCRSDPTRDWWLAQPIIKNGILASWIVDRLRARGLPPKLVNPVECTPLAGFTDHLRLECGNSHTDVGRNFPWTKLTNQVQALYNAGQTKMVWRVVSGGTILVQRGLYRGAARWLRLHPRIVSLAERRNGSVNLRRVSVPIS